MFVKDPDAELDYRIDWSALCGGGLSIVDSRWSVAPADTAAVVVIGHGHDARTAHVRVGGGAVGAVCRLANRVRLSDGMIDERTLVVRVEER